MGEGSGRGFMIGGVGVGAAESSRPYGGGLASVRRRDFYSGRVVGVITRVSFPD